MLRAREYSSTGWIEFEIAGDENRREVESSGPLGLRFRASGSVQGIPLLLAFL